MLIQYDQNKNDTNIKERGIDFEQARYFEFETAFQKIDARKDYGGIRVISFRKAN